MPTGNRWKTTFSAKWNGWKGSLISLVGGTFRCDYFSMRRSVRPKVRSSNGGPSVFRNVFSSMAGDRLFSRARYVSLSENVSISACLYVCLYIYLYIFCSKTRLKRNGREQPLESASAMAAYPALILYTFALLNNAVAIDPSMALASELRSLDTIWLWAWSYRFIY